MATPKGKKTVVAHLDEDLYERLRKAAEDNHRSMAATVRALIDRSTKP